MKKISAIILLSMLAAGPAAAETPARPTPADSKAQPEGRYTGAVFNALRNLSAMLPKQNGRSADPRQSATMGIRGAETTTSLLTPYWKDDQLDNPSFQAEMKSYNEAQQLLEDGKLAEAETALNGFIQTHPDSDLLPNARFALALTFTAQGDSRKGKDALDAFIKTYPQHPLASDAQKVAAEVK